MTLIIATINQDAAVVAADTRLTSNGRLQDDSSAKTGIIRCFEGRLIYAYTGLARTSGFETRRWILDSILDVWKPWHTAEEGLALLKAKATKDFSSLPHSRKRVPPISG